MPSLIDQIFKDIFGYIPKKKGAAYEILAAIASYLLEEGSVRHNEYIRGQFSDTLYQIDVHHTSTQEGTSSIGEVKDYSERGKKVGRGELQKLAGALPDLDSVDSGAFFSVTGYTKPAKKYAESVHNVTGGKSIHLYELRPSVESDEHGFIKTIVIKLCIMSPTPREGKWTPRLTEKGEMTLKNLLSKGEESRRYDTVLDCFYDEFGNKTLTLQELTSHGYGDINRETGKVHGSFLLPNLFIRIDGILAEIRGLEYEIPFTYSAQEIRITDDSQHRFVITDKDGNVLKFLTDKILRTFSFDEDGNLLKR